MNKKYAELDFPAWFDGKDVNEAAFCREFLSKNKLIYADNAFFTPDGRLTDPLLLKEKIYAELECCAAKNIPRTISNIVEIMKLAAHAESFPPKPDEIHVQNGTLRIDGSFLAGRPEIVRSRFPVAYNPQAEKPVVWLRFLSDLLYPEDIPTFQEYIGYCLVPSTKGQRMMILKGEGGEGKSQIGPVLARLFGCNMKDGSIAKISDNRFARADLEHIHLLVDDDMKMEALKQTNYVKSIVTAQGKMDLERKSVQSYQGWMYFAVHSPDKEDVGIPNPHFHIMCPIRPIEPDGKWGNKQRREYVLDEHGERIRDEAGNYVFNAAPTTDWGSPETLEHWRQEWAELCNAKFAEKGLDCRIDHRSYARQGIEQIPTVHEGPSVRAMEANGIRTVKGDFNRWVRKTNAMLREAKNKITSLLKWLKAVKEELSKPQPPMLNDLLMTYYNNRNNGALTVSFSVRLSTE